LVGEETKLFQPWSSHQLHDRKTKAISAGILYRPRTVSFLEMGMIRSPTTENIRSPFRSLTKPTEQCLEYPIITAICEGVKFARLTIMAKVLSLLQPWASLAVMGLKTIETRSWGTQYRGPLFIHAGLRRSGKTMWAKSMLLQEYIPDFETLPLGAIIGEVQLREVLRLGALNLSPEAFRRQSLEERAFSEAPQRFAWIFSDAHLFQEPIPATGRLGLWEH
jgi:hypothetical protein